MAVLSDRATDGRISFIKYVAENQRLAEIEFEIERNKTSPLYVEKKSQIVPGTKILQAGTKLSITSREWVEVSNLKMAAVKVGTTAGYLPINVIRKPTGGNGTQYEDEVVDAINSYILKAGGKIDIRLEGDRRVYRDITHAIKVDTAIKRLGAVKGDPKADIILTKDPKNPLAAGSIYVSHKKEGGPEAFQQYGGLSEQAGEGIYNHRLVQKFLDVVAKQIGVGDALPAPVMGTFKDPTLANMSIYGPEYGGPFSLQHVQVIGQGKPTFRVERDTAILGFSSHSSVSGNLSHFTGGYTPVLGATYRAGRGFTYQGKRYDGARVAIYPHKLMATRGGLITVNIR